MKFSELIKIIFYKRISVLYLLLFRHGLRNVATGQTIFIVAVDKPFLRLGTSYSIPGRGTTIKKNHKSLDAHEVLTIVTFNLMFLCGLSQTLV